MNDIVNIKYLYCGQHYSACEKHCLFCIQLKIIIVSGLVAKPKSIGSSLQLDPSLGLVPNNIGQICLIQILGLQFTLSKPVDLLGQPETRVTQQKPGRDLFFIFFSWLLTHFKVHYINNILNLIVYNMYSLYSHELFLNFFLYKLIKHQIFLKKFSG